CNFQILVSCLKVNAQHPGRELILTPRLIRKVGGRSGSSQLVEAFVHCSRVTYLESQLSGLDLLPQRGEPLLDLRGSQSFTLLVIDLPHLLDAPLRAGGKTEERGRQQRHKHKRKEES